MKYKYIQSNRLIVRGGKDGQEINKKDKKESAIVFTRAWLCLE